MIALLNAPYLTEGQIIEIFLPEGRGVGPVKPVVGAQVGGIDVPRVAGSEVVRQIVGGVLVGEIG